MGDVTTLDEALSEMRAADYPEGTVLAFSRQVIGAGGQLPGTQELLSVAPVREATVPCDYDYAVIEYRS